MKLEWTFPNFLEAVISIFYHNSFRAPPNHPARGTVEALLWSRGTVEALLWLPGPKLNVPFPIWNLLCILNYPYQKWKCVAILSAKCPMILLQTSKRSLPLNGHNPSPNWQAILPLKSPQSFAELRSDPSPNWQVILPLKWPTILLPNWQTTFHLKMPTIIPLTGKWSFCWNGPHSFCWNVPQFLPPNGPLQSASHCLARFQPNSLCWRVSCEFWISFSLCEKTDRSRLREVGLDRNSFYGYEVVSKNWKILIRSNRQKNDEKSIQIGTKNWLLKNEKVRNNL